MCVINLIFPCIFQRIRQYYSAIYCEEWLPALQISYSLLGLKYENIKVECSLTINLNIFNGIVVLLESILLRIDFYFKHLNEEFPHYFRDENICKKTTLFFFLKIQLCLSSVLGEKTFLFAMITTTNSGPQSNPSTRETNKPGHLMHCIHIKYI